MRDTGATPHASTFDILFAYVEETVIVLDAAHRGLGTASCGPDTLPRYLVRPGVHRWAWSIRTV